MKTRIARAGVSRRRFLATSTAAAAAPFILPSRIWSAPVGPNERITLGFIGMGTQGRGLMGGFLGRDDVEVVAVCDVDRDRRNFAKGQVAEYYLSKGPPGFYPHCVAFTDFRDVLGRPDIDGVVIATPDHWHAIIGIAAAEAGKDIYCEKPLTLSIHEAQAMAEAMRRRKRVFQTGSMQRSSKEFRTACELVRNGAIGRIQEIRVAIGGPGVRCDLPGEADQPDLDWNLWLGPAPWREYNSELSPRGVHKHFPNWRRYYEYGGGMVTDWGAHHFDIAQWALGMDNSGPVEIYPPDTPGAVSGVHFIYDNGAVMWHDPGNGVTFLGADGRIYVNRGKFEFERNGEQLASSPDQCDAIAAAHLPPKAVRLESSSDHKTNWLECMRTRRQPICNADVGAHTVTVCHLCNLAYWHGQVMKWNPARWEFVGGTGNPRWLDVPYREPWGLKWV